MPRQEEILLLGCRRQAVDSTLSIDGIAVGHVNNYKYWDTTLDQKLTFNDKIVQGA